MLSLKAHITNFRKKADVAVEGSLKSSKRTFNASKPKGGPSMSTPTHYIDIYRAMGGVPQAQIEAYRAPPREWMTGRWPAGRVSHDPPPVPSEWKLVKMKLCGETRNSENALNSHLDLMPLV